jgi:hypothetical protein
MEMLAKKILPDGRQAEVMPLTFGRARIIVGDGVTVDDSW